MKDFFKNFFKININDINSQLNVRDLISILDDINVLLTKSFEDFNDTLWTIVSSISNIFKVTKVSILHYNDKEEIFLPIFSFGLNNEELSEFLRGSATIQNNLLKAEQHIFNNKGKLHKEYKKLMSKFNINSIIFDPITLRGEKIGWFIIADKIDKAFFSKEEIKLLNSILPIYKIIIQNAILHSEEKKKAENLEHLRNIDRMLLKSKNLSQVMEKIVENLVKIFKVESSAVLLLDKEKENLNIYCARGIAPKFIKKIKIPIGQGVTGLSALEKKTIRSNNVLNDERYISYPGSKTKSEMATPLLIDDELIGVINLESIEKNKFTKKDEELFEDFALNTAIILKWIMENENKK